MSAAFYIVLDSPEPGFETYVNGKALSQAAAAIEAAALKAGVTPLTDFFSMSPDVAADLAEELGGEMEEVTPPAEQWFAAEDGLRTVRALLAVVTSDPSALGTGVREELLEFEEVLRKAKDRSLRWHLAIDY